MHPPINFGEIPSPSISHAHPKIPRPTKKKALSENKVREIDELDTFIVKNNFNCDTVKEALQESLLLYGSVLVMQIEQNKHLPASVAVVVCMNMLYTSILDLEMQMQE